MWLLIVLSVYYEMDCWSLIIYASQVMKGINLGLGPVTSHWENITSPTVLPRALIFNIYLLQYKSNTNMCLKYWSRQLSVLNISHTYHTALRFGKPFAYFSKMDTYLFLTMWFYLTTNKVLNYGYINIIRGE